MIGQSSTALFEKIDKFESNVESNLFKLDVSLRSTEDTDLVLDLPLIDSITIDQRFNIDYTDDIEMIARIHVKDYMRLIDKLQDLYVVMTITYLDRDTGELLLEVTPVIYIFRCIIKNAYDLTQRYYLSSVVEPDESEGETGDYDNVLIDAHFQLMDELAYQIRHKKTNFILHNTNVEQCIKYACRMFGIEQIYLEQPDNVDVLPHHIITPPKGFTDIFDYIQYRYGVYYSGLEYYYTDNTLWVYKAYDTKPSGNSTVNIYHASHGTYAGLKGYHYLEDNDIHILSNTTVETKNLVELGIENQGNSITMLRSDTVLDNGRTVTNDKGMIIDPTNTISVDLTTEKGMVKSVINSSHLGTSSNIYAAASELIKNEANLVGLGWMCSKPFLIKPGHRVMYHYDDKDKYQYRTGRCEAITHSIQLVTRTMEHIYTCNSTMLLRIALK